MASQGTPTYIVQAVRSPVGKAGGGLAQVHPADLGAAVIAELIDRSTIDPGVVDDVMIGNVDSVGPQAGCIARTAWLVADMPEHVPGTTIDRRCGSSQQAVHFAAQAIMAGQADVIVAGGIQSMSQVPMMQAFAMPGDDDFDPFTSSPGWVKRYGDTRFDQFDGAEQIAQRWDISRDDMEQFALESHRRALGTKLVPDVPTFVNCIGSELASASVRGISSFISKLTAAAKLDFATFFNAPALPS